MPRTSSPTPEGYYRVNVDVPEKVYVSLGLLAARALSSRKSTLEALLLCIDFDAPNFVDEVLSRARTARQLRLDAAASAAAAAVAGRNGGAATPEAAGVAVSMSEPAAVTCGRVPTGERTRRRIGGVK